MCIPYNSAEISCPIAKGNCSKSVSIRWTILSQKNVFHEMFLWTCKMKFCQLCRKNFAEDWKKFLLNEKKIWITTFQRKWLSLRCCYGDIIAVLKIVPKNNAPDVWMVFIERPETVSKKFLWNKYFNPKCSFGHIKCKTDETERNSHWESEAIYLEVGKWLMPYTTFFRNNISLSLFRWHKECGFDNAAKQLSEKSEKKSLKPEKVWKLKKKISHQMFFRELIVWHVDCSSRNPADKIKTKMKLNQSKYKKTQKDLHNAQKVCSSKCRLDIEVVSTTVPMFSSKKSGDFSFKVRNWYNNSKFLKERNFIKSFLCIRWMQFWQNWQNYFARKFENAPVKVLKPAEKVFCQKGNFFFKTFL